MVVQSADGRTVLYDCGRMGDPHVGRRVIAPALWSRGVRRIDVVILSHADADHYNGLPDLLDRFAIGAVLVPPGFAGPANPGASGCSTTSGPGASPSRRSPRGTGSTWAAGPTLAVLHPRRDSRPGSTDNARSVVLEVASGGRRLLLTGDLEGDGLTDLVAPPSAGPLDAMLAPHHGGRTANPPGSTTGPGPPWSSSASGRRRPARETPSRRWPRGIPAAPDLAGRGGPAPLVPRGPGRRRLPRPARAAGLRRRSLASAMPPRLVEGPRPRSWAWRRGRRSAWS